MRNVYVYHLIRGSPVLLWHRYYQLQLILIRFVSFYFLINRSNNYLTLSTISTKRQFLVLLSGRVSMIVTVSPILHSFFSSCATNLEVLFTNLPYFGCFTLRITATTIDLFILLLVTIPVFSFLKFLS